MASTPPTMADVLARLDELEEENRRLRRRIVELEAENAQLRQTIKQLEAKLKRRKKRSSRTGSRSSSGRGGSKPTSSQNAATEAAPVTDGAGSTTEGPPVDAATGSAAEDSTAKQESSPNIDDASAVEAEDPLGHIPRPTPPKLEELGVPDAPDSDSPKKGRRARDIEHGHTEVHRSTSCPNCMGTTLKVLGYERAFPLTLILPKLREILVKRCRLLCTKCGHKHVTPVPPRPLPFAGVMPSLVVWAITMKVLWHVPMYRLAQMLASWGSSVSDSTLTRWMHEAAERCRPLFELLVVEAKKQTVIHVDGTEFPVLHQDRHSEAGPDKGRPTGRAVGRKVLTVSGDVAVLYFLLESKHGENIEAELEGFEAAFLVADAEANQNGLYTADREECGCNAHGRRKLREAEAGSKRLAAEGGQFLSTIYALEKRGKERGLSGPSLLYWRTTYIGPVVASFKKWLRAVQPYLMDGTELRLAVNYYLRHWDALTRFMSDGTIPLDNNFAERLLRPVVKGRQNWLFCDRDETARNFLELASLLRTAELHGVPVQAWLEDVLVKLDEHRDNHDVELSDLLPWNWAAGQQESALAA